MEQLLRHHATGSPEAAAVIEGSVVLTYAQLLREAEQIVRALGDTLPDEPIGILLGAGRKQIVAQVAVRLAGATCVPLEPSLPVQRTGALLKAAHVRRIIVREDGGSFDDLPQILIGDMPPPLLHYTEPPAGQPNGVEHPDDVRSHILFTSGSTGRPKAVQIREQSILNLAKATEVTPLLTTDRVAAFNDPGFDLSLFEMWVPLLCGATIVVVPKAVIADPGALPSFFHDSAISIAIMPTALFHITAASSPDAFHGLRHLIVAGETVNPKAVSAVLAHDGPTHLWNAYGPTECTTMVTMFEVTADEAQRDQISIGFPVGNSEVFLLGEDLKPVAPGAQGEIFVAGASLSRGYLDAESANEGAFLDLPRSTLGTGSRGQDETLRVYRTGDMGRWRLDHRPGCLDFIGRRDTQVKHLGFRVDLGEVERVLVSYEQVSSAVVVYQPPSFPFTSSALMAYVFPSSRGACDQQALLRFARESLPAYMVPTRIQVVDSVPLTPHGKVDRKAMVGYDRETVAQSEVRAEDPTQLTGPAADIQATLCAIWKEVLHLPDIPANGDFFLLGGSSIQSAALIALICERLGRVMTMAELHAHSRLADLVTFVARDPNLPGSSVSDDPSTLLRDVDLLTEEIDLVPEWDSPSEGRVFLTGATGFVGAHFLHHTILRPNVRQVVCLARSQGVQSAASRVQAAMAQYDLWPDSFELSQKITVLEGDLGDRDLGLGAEQFTWLTNAVSAVFHLGAKVNFCDPYRDHFRDNVQGTVNVLRVASSGRRKSFHYMSSLDVWGPAGLVLGSRHIPEDDPLIPYLPSSRYDTGYGQSQWSAEAIVRRMQEKGLPVAIYRPGFIVGDSRTGAGNPNDFISRLLVGCIQLGSFPRIVDMRFEYTPIDFVVRATLQIASSNQNLGHSYHVLPAEQRDSPSVEDTCGLLNELGYPVQLVEYKRWLELVAQGPADGPLAPLLPVLQEKVMGDLTRWEVSQFSPRYDCNNCTRALADSPEIRLSPVTSDLIRRYLDFWERKGMYRVGRGL